MRKHDEQLSLRLPKQLLEAINQAANELNEPISRFVKRSLVAYLDFHNRISRPVIESNNRQKYISYEQEE